MFPDRGAIRNPARSVTSLTRSFEGFELAEARWFCLERMCRHGIRDTEMREAVATIEEAGLPADMTRSTVSGSNVSVIWGCLWTPMAQSCPADRSTKS